MPYLIRVENLLGLGLLAFLPVLWLAYRHLVNALGRSRAGLAIVLRSLLVLLLIVAICEPFWVMVNKHLSVLLVVDRSASVSNERLEQATALLAGHLEDHKRQRGEDRVGVIGFAQTPVVEVPVDAFGMDWQGDFGTSVNRDQTDIHSAMKLAGAIMPTEGARRIVVVSDGAETVGQAAEAASGLSEQGIGIDAIAISDDRLRDVLLEKVESPALARPSFPFDVRVVMRYLNQENNDSASGRLDVLRIVQGSEQLLASQEIDLSLGVNIFTFRDQLAASGVYSYRARFTPRDKQSDRFEKNNIAESFVQIAGDGRILLVVEPGREGEYRWITELLTKEKIAVDVRASPLSFASLVDFQSYDLIILADVPRYLGGNPAAAESLSQSSLQLMRQATESTGCGLLMIGGPNSFGNGDWKETPIEQAMPVRFDVKNAKVQAATALELVIDSSGSMEGLKLQMCRAAARQAVLNLKSFDYVGVISFDSYAHEIVKLQKASSRELIARLISRLAAGGGTNMYPALQQAFYRLNSNPSSVKHVLLMTDGQTPGADYIALVQQMRQAGITISCMAIGNDADQTLLSSIANTSGGQFYKVVSPVAIPRVVISETRRIARPLIFEYPAGFSPSITSSHPVVDNIPRQLPPISGFVLTTPKDSPLVETLITSPMPVGEDYPILATWQYGLGRTAAWTTDAGQQWSHAWADSDSQQRLLLQLVRWLMRVEASSARMQLVTNVKGKEVEMLVTALDDASQPLNGLLPVGTLSTPQGEAERVTLDQMGPGTYRATADVGEFGTHIASVSLGSEGAILRSAFTVHYSDEFRLDNTGRLKLEQMAHLSPVGGKPGQLFEISNKTTTDKLPIDLFRRDLPSQPSETPAWPALVLGCSALLFLDIANRRIAWNGINRLRRRSNSPTVALQGVKPAKSSASAAKPNASTFRMEDPDDIQDTLDALESPKTAASSKLDSRSISTMADSVEGLSYAERLKRAKQEAQRNSSKLNK